MRRTLKGGTPTPAEIVAQGANFSRIMLGGNATEAAMAKATPKPNNERLRDPRCASKNGVNTA